MRYIWSKQRREFVEPHVFYADQQEMQRSSLPLPYIRSDGMQDTLNHVDGKHYSSKSGYEASLREASKRDGTDYQVVGNDKSVGKPINKYDNMGLKADIQKAFAEHS